MAENDEQVPHEEQHEAAAEHEGPLVGADAEQHEQHDADDEELLDGDADELAVDNKLELSIGQDMELAHLQGLLRDANSALTAEGIKGMYLADPKSVWALVKSLMVPRSAAAGSSSSSSRGLDMAKAMQSSKPGMLYAGDTAK
jgi:hypothetical protein